MNREVEGGLDFGIRLHTAELKSEAAIKAGNASSSLECLDERFDPCVLLSRVLRGSQVIPKTNPGLSGARGKTEA